MVKINVYYKILVSFMYRNLLNADIVKLFSKFFFVQINLIHLA